MQSSPTYSAVKLHLSESDRIFRTGGAHLERGYRDIARTSYAYSFGTVISILLDIVRVGGPSDRRVYRGFHRCQTIAVFRESKSFLYYTLLVYSFLQAINFNLEAIQSIKVRSEKLLPRRFVVFNDSINLLDPCIGRLIEVSEFIYSSRHFNCEGLLIDLRKGSVQSQQHQPLLTTAAFGGFDLSQAMFPFSVMFEVSTYSIPGSSVRISCLTIFIPTMFFLLVRLV